MPTNFYFNTGAVEEKRFYEDLVIEQIRAFGQDVYYMPRTLVAEDTLLGEDALSKFDNAYMIEAYFENTDGFAGDKEIMSQFGLEQREEATFVVSQRRFEEILGADNNMSEVKSSGVEDASGTVIETTIPRPFEGDLIYFPLVNKVFEISFVDHDEPFYQIGNLPVYKISVRTFEYSSEDLDTGIEAIDDIETALSTDSMQFQFTLEQSGTYNEQFRMEDNDDRVGLFEDGTPGTVSGTDSTSVVQNEDETMTGSLILENEADSGLPQYIIQESFVDVGDETHDKTAQNELFDRLDDTVLDFSETNPFGDVGRK